MTDPLGNLRSARLTLIPATVAILEAALSDVGELGRLLDATVPASWPPQFLDEGALRYTLAQLAEHPGAAEWWMYFIVLTTEREPRTLIGTGGFKGPPSPEGNVEIGYGIVDDHHRRGYGSEAARALVDKAFAVAAVRRVVAETLPELLGSIGVLKRCGFAFVGPGSEQGVIRFALERSGA